MKQLIQKLSNRCKYQIKLLLNSKNESSAFSAMKSLASNIEEPIIFDVGAHHGCMSKPFRKLFPESTIYAFELFPEFFEILKKNTSSDPRIVTLDYGLSNREGYQTFYSNLSSQTNSLFPTDEDSKQTWGDGVLENKKPIEIYLKTIDSVMKEMEIPRIDILKLDVQGAEYLVMKGASLACEKKAIHLIYS